MKKKLLALGLGIILLVMAGMAQASLVTIGTATYSGSDYNLIWDNNNNGNSVIWLDFSNPQTTWAAQTSWAAGLNLTNLNTPGYIISWTDNAWRLPSAGTSPNSGYGQTTSEMGGLFYTELGLDGGASYHHTATELNASNFDNLIAATYWSTAHTSSTSWDFSMSSGYQGSIGTLHGSEYGLAIRSGNVSAVPIPGALWLLGSGLFGLVAVRRKKKS